MNCFKVKIQGGFNLTMLKVKYIHYKRIEVFTIRFNPKSIATASSNLLTRSRANTESTDPFCSWTYYNTSTHACDFEISLKGFRSASLVDLCSSNQILPTLDCRSCSSRHLCSKKVQYLSDLTKSNTQVFQRSPKRSQGFSFICGQSQIETLNVFMGLGLV